MRLQSNDSGGWKNVIKFSANELAYVKHYAEKLGAIAALAGQQVKFRVLDDGDEWITHWTAPKGWVAWVHPGIAAVGKDA